MGTAIETLSREVQTIPQEISGQNGCCHHWVIETPNGPVSRGECKYCHEERAFRNSMRGIIPVREHGVRKFVYEASHKLLQPARKSIA